jgi:hypothetical protein
MIKYEFFKNQIIIILFSLSIFLSYVSISFLEFRFLYLFIFIFLLYDSSFFKKLSLNYILVSLAIPLLILLYSSIFLFINFNDMNFIKFIKEPSTINFILKISVQSIVIGLTILIICFYKKFLILNIIKIIDYFAVIFILLIFLYNINHEGILFDTLYKCDLGFFYITKYLFTENSHFNIISIPVITSFIYNIKIYLKKYFMLFIHLCFLIFSLGSFSLTFYLSIFSSIIIIFITCKNMSRISKYLFLILLIVVNLFMFMDKKENELHNHTVDGVVYKTCISQAVELKTKYNLEKKLDSSLVYKGIVLSEKEKFGSIFKKRNKVLSSGIVIYSLYVAKESIINNQLGVGINNYKNYRDVIDKKLNINNYSDYTKNLAGEIIFDESYMPSLSSTILSFNKNSGSNNFSKLIVEFGLIPILGLFLIFIFSFRKEINEPIKATLIPLIFIQCFIRGTGYFDSGFIISLIIVLVLISEQVIKKYENKNIK